MSVLQCSPVYILLSVLFYAGPSCIALTDKIGDENDREAHQTRFNLFDADLLKELSISEAGNFLVSPASIKTLLALLLEGAEGSTLTEIHRVLRLSDNATEARRQLGNLQYVLQKTMYSRVKVDSVAQAFVSEALVINNTFAMTIKDHYNAEVTPQDFTQPEVAINNINSWINTRTRGLIPTLLDEGFINRDTYSILVSAVYFDGKWKNEFQRLHTRPACFYSGPNLQCQVTPMMSKTEDLFYKFDVTVDAHVLQVPYKDERFFMVIVLPSKRNGIEQLSLDSFRLMLPALTENMSLYEVNLTMPSFTAEFGTELTGTLKAIGLNDLFSDSAKLPYMINNKQGKVSAMIHKSIIEVNEKGTKAAAGSGASVVPLINNMDSINLEVNHPFYYFVCEVETQSVLFMGRLSTIPNTDEENKSMQPEAHIEPLQPGPAAQQLDKRPSVHGALNFQYQQPTTLSSSPTGIRRRQKGV